MSEVAMRKTPAKATIKAQATANQSFHSRIHANFRK
jgi:hypothetical protein